ncbi:MAG: ribulose-phosphate 3-epimerase [Anaerolineales bacterium]|nr:ribulose-phosphate 3-epimerase [Anaerolineales bacterium]
MTKIAPSILSADFLRLGDQVQEVLDAGADILHLDVMDGHFVPNITIGPLVVKAIKKLTLAANVPLDVHLMVKNPDHLIPHFAQAGADMLTVHVEACKHLHRTIQQIRQLGMKPGVSLNPATPLGVLEEMLPFIDLVLIMSVNPGFGGQSYIPTSTAKIERLRWLLDKQRLSNVELEVDGGIKSDNAAMIAAAGASVLVVGTGIFNDNASIISNFQKLRQVLSSSS